MIRPQGTFEPSSDWSLNNVAACVSCDHMWSPNCFSDSAYSTIDKLASFYDTTSFAPTYPNHFGCNLGPKHLPPIVLCCWFLSFPWFLKLVQHAQYIPAGKFPTCQHPLTVRKTTEFQSPLRSLSISSGDSVTVGWLLLVPSSCRWYPSRRPKNSWKGFPIFC